MINLTLLFIFSMSYAWGMRGSIIGASKGAMLPGAITGLMFAWCSGSDILQQNALVFAAIGAAGMYFGGEMTYADTVDFTMKGMRHKGFFKGMAGFFVKGALWLGICTAMLTVALSFSAGMCYSTSDILAMSVLTMPVFFLGVMLLNRPFNSKTGKRPLIYFSTVHKESWGGLLGVFLMLLIWAAVRGDTYTLITAGCSAACGGVTWVIGQALQVYTCLPRKNGKFVFGGSKQSRFVDCWKIMETVFGALMALGMAVIYVATYSRLSVITAKIEENGGLFAPLAKYDTAATVLWAVLFAVSIAYLFFGVRGKKGELDTMRAERLVTEKEYEAGLVLVERPSSRYFSKVETVSDLFAFFCMACLPFAAITGFYTVSVITAVFSLSFVLAERLSSIQFIYRSNRNILRALMLIFCGLLLLGVFIFPEKYTVRFTWMLYSVSYLLMQFVWLFRPSRLSQLKHEKGTGGMLNSLGSIVSVQAYFTACVIYMIVSGVFTFA